MPVWLLLEQRAFLVLYWSFLVFLFECFSAILSSCFIHPILFLFAFYGFRISFLILLDLLFRFCLILFSCWFVVSFLAIDAPHSPKGASLPRLSGKRKSINKKMLHRSFSASGALSFDTEGMF